MKKGLLLLLTAFALKTAQAQCPDLATARKPMASSFHSSILITHDSLVRYWGDAASVTLTAGAATNVPSPLTLTLYTGIPLSVAGGSTAAGDHQLYLQTTTNIYGWGNSNNTIVGGTAGDVAFTTISLPGTVTISQVSFIEAAGGALALVTTSGNVWVKNGGTGGGSPLIYGDGSTTFNTSWHQVETSAGVNLSGVTRLSMSARGMMALTGSGQLYTWGDQVLLGDGSAASTYSRATLMTKPTGVTPTDVNINTKLDYNTFNVTASQFILGSNSKMYGIGENYNGQLGQGTTTDAVNWVAVKNAAGTDTLSNIIQIGSNNPFVLNNSSLAVDTLGGTLGSGNGGYAIGALNSSGELYLWGQNNYDMIGNDTLVTKMTQVQYNLPRRPANFIYNNAAVGYFEMGGHTTAAFLQGSSKFCYIGHKIRGSMGDGTVTDLTRKSFDCINTPEEFVCPPQPVVSCPLPSASDVVASSVHATLAINGDPAVAFWGEAASSAEPGVNMVNAKTLYEYNGTPIGVAASGVSTGSSAQSTQMFVHTDMGIWGWGFSANTIMANRVNAAPISYITLPSGVVASDISFIRSSKGGLALITKLAAGGNVWVLAGFNSSCSGSIYGTGVTALDPAGSTVWHKVTKSVAGNPALDSVIEMSFGGTAALAITAGGKAFVWGENVYTGSGAASSLTRANQMTLHSDFVTPIVPRTAEIIQTSGSNAVQFILGSNNKIYSIGSNLNGALGTGTAPGAGTSTWNALSSPLGVRKLSSNNPYADGFYSVGAITLTGNVYLWGSNTNGIIGAGAATNVTAPTVIPTTDIAANIATNFEIGGGHTIVFVKTSSAFYFAGRSVGGSKADGSSTATTNTTFATAGTVANCASVSFNLTGNLFNDPNGLTNNVVDGVVVSALSTVPMYANLLDEAGYVIASTAITSGAYAFNGYPFGNYYVQVSPTAGTAFSLAPTTALPGNWVNVGEQIGTVAGVGVDTGAPNGKIFVSLNGNKTNVNFGVELKPTPVPVTLATTPNPGGTNVKIITSAFTGLDTGGTVSNIRITAFPTNVTSIKIGDTTYTAATVAALTARVFPVGTVISLDPVDGVVTSVIPFSVYDNANVQSNASANVTVPFNLIPPVANNITAPALNSSDTARAIPQLKASNPSGTGIKSYTIRTIPPATEGVLYYCSTAPTVCALGSLTPVVAGTAITPAQSASLYFNPAQGFMSKVSFTYDALDSNNLVSNTANYIIPVFNNPPVTQSIFTAKIVDTTSAARIPGLLGADNDGVVVNYTLSSIPASTQGTLSYCVGGAIPCAVAEATIAPGSTTVLTPAEMLTMKFDPVLGFAGNYIFNYIATDNNNLPGNSSTYTIPVVPVSGLTGNLPPLATNITAQNINNSLGRTPIPNLLGTDPDGTINRYTIGATLPPSSEGVLYYCAGTGTCTPGTLSAITAGMNLTPLEATTLHFDPAPGFTGTSSFTYTVTDNDGTPLTSAPATYKIPVVNNPPVANPTSVSPINNAKVTPTLLPPLTGNDADGTVVSYNIVTVPAATSGTLKYCVGPAACTAVTLTTITAGITGLTPAQVATLNFIPVSTFTGDYVFTFTTVDNNGLVSEPATFTIPVIATPVGVGQPPLAYSYNNAPISSTATALLSTALTGTDPDGTVSNFTITSLPVASHGVLTYCKTPPATDCGTTVTLGMIMSQAQANTITFTPASGFMGVATFNYTNKDNDSNVSNTATVTIPVVNNPPVAKNINNSAVSRLSPAVTLNPLSSTDADGTVQTYTILTVPTIDQGVLRLCTAPPATGCTAVVPGQVLTPAQINLLSFQPNEKVHVPVVSFLYMTTDNSGNLSNVATVNIPISDAFVLPLDLISFTASKQGRNAMIIWETGVEKEPIIYELMHSIDAKTWKSIDRQNSLGSGNITNHYSYLHTSVSGGIQYYRLDISNQMGEHKYSPVRSLNFDNVQAYSIMVQPNPVADKLYVSTSDNSVMDMVILYNNEGKKLQVMQDVSSGTVINMNTYNPGMYILQIIDKNGATQSIKVNKN